MKRWICILMIFALLGGMGMVSTATAASDENLYEEGKAITLSQGDELLIGPYDAKEKNLGEVDGESLIYSQMNYQLIVRATFPQGQKLYSFRPEADCAFIPNVGEAYKEMFLAKKYAYTGLSDKDYYAYWDDRGANLYNETLDGIDGYKTSFTNRNFTKNHRCTHFVAVEEGDTITFGPANPSQSFHAVGLKANGSAADSQITASEMKSVSSEKIQNNLVFYTYQVPAGMAYISIINYTPVQSFFVALKNQPSLTPKRYYEYLGAIENNPLYGKTALFVGDSISYGENDAVQNDIRLAWAGRVGLSNGLTYTNASVSGASLSTMRGSRVVRQLDNQRDKDFDFVVIHGGVNDAWGNGEEGYIPAPIGEMTEGFPFTSFGAFDLSTYAGGLEDTFHAAKHHFPDAKLIYIMNFKAPECPRGTVSDMSAYFEMGRKICEKWGVFVCDLYSRYTFDNPNHLDDRMIHPNQYGYDILYPAVAAAMKASVLAPEIESLIEEIGLSIERSDIPAMDEARKAYDQLGEDLRAYVKNYNLLLMAENYMKSCPAGDVTADGKLSIADICLMLRKIVDPDMPLNKINHHVADFDGNGSIETIDAIMALRKLLEK